MGHFKKIDNTKDDVDGMISREEFVDFFMTRNQENLESDNILSSVIATNGIRGLNDTNLLDRILFGIKTMDTHELKRQKSR